MTMILANLFRSAQKRLSRWPSGQRGMTILEVLIASLIGILVCIAAMDAYLTMQSATLMQDEITEMQQSGRAAMRVLSERLRMAGFSLPASLDGLVTGNGNPDTLTVRYMDADGCEVSTAVGMASTTSPIDCTGEDLSCFHVGRPAYIFNATTGTGEFFNLVGVTSSPATMTHAALSATYPVGARVSFIRELTFFLNRADTLHPKLMMREFAEAPQVYAENIEDFQVRYVMMNDDTVNVTTTPTLVRNVLVDLVSRTDRIDKLQEQDYRRRTFSFQVSVRNNE